MGKRVFVVNDSGHDFTAATKHGELVMLTEGKVNVFATDRLVRELEAKLAAATVDDFLMPVGNGLASCLAFGILMNRFARVNLLIYSFKDELYELRTVKAAQFKSVLPREVA